MNNEEVQDLYYWKAEELLRDGNPAEALQCTQAALEVCEVSVEALLQAGEIHLYYGVDMGLTSEASSAAALVYFDRAVRAERSHAGAWSGKAFAELYLGRLTAALNSVQTGFGFIRSGVGYAMGYEPVNTNVLESLYRCKVLVLLEMGRHADARRTLSEGLAAVPMSAYLTQLVDEFVSGP